jgi:hypothetical protein
MYVPLTFQHPHDWLEKSPSRVWNRKSSSWVYRPRQVDGLSDWYRAYLLGRLDAHALRILNLHWEPDDDTLAMLSRNLREHAIAAGKRVGVTFHTGRSTPTQDLAGELSLDWLSKATTDAAVFALDVWDPAIAERRHQAAARGGEGSSLGLTPADLIPLEGKSISVQAKALGCSPRTISYLRTALRQSAES